jgi:hypothetical protein
MKRLDVHVVENLTDATAFYSTLVAATPAIVNPDYALHQLSGGP